MCRNSLWFLCLLHGFLVITVCSSEFWFLPSSEFWFVFHSSCYFQFVNCLFSSLSVSQSVPPSVFVFLHSLNELIYVLFICLVSVSPCYSCGHREHENWLLKFLFEAFRWTFLPSPSWLQKTDVTRRGGSDCETAHSLANDLWFILLANAHVVT